MCQCGTPKGTGNVAHVSTGVRVLHAASGDGEEARFVVVPCKQLSSTYIMLRQCSSLSKHCLWKHRHSPGKQLCCNVTKALEQPCERHGSAL